MKLNQKGIASVLIAVVIVLVLIAGAGFYVLQKDSDDPEQNSTTPTAVNTADGKIEPPYRITATIVDSSDKTKNSNVTVDYVSDKNWKIVSKSSEGTSEVVFTGDYQYLNNGGKWTRIPYSAGNTDNTTSIDAYNVSNDDIQNYKDNSTQQPDEACGSATCEVFKVTNPSGFDTATIYINKSNGNFTKLVYQKGSTTTTVEYDFDSPVSAEAPADYQDLQIPSGQ